MDIGSTLILDRPSVQSLSPSVGARLTRFLSPNVYVQLLTLASGLLVAFLFPIVFGLDAYGEFLKYILPTLLVHKIIDSMSEVLIPDLGPDEIFIGSFVPGVLTAGIAMAAFALFSAPGPDPLLLLAMVATSSTLLACYRNQFTWALVGLLGLFCVNFVALTGLQFIGVDIGLRNIMLFANLAGAVAGAAVLALRRALFPRGSAVWGHAWTGVRRLPLSLSSTLMMNTITVGFLWLSAPNMTAVAVGQLRVLSSIVQASVSLFPVSLKAIFVRLSNDAATFDFGALLSAAFWFFLAGFWALQVLGLVSPPLKALADVFLVTIPFYWAACMERHAQATRRRVAYRVINILLCAASLVVAVVAARRGLTIHGYAAIIGCYCLALAPLGRSAGQIARIVVLLLAATGATLLILSGLAPAWAGGLAVMAAGLLVLPPHLRLLPFYRGHIS